MFCNKCGKALDFECSDLDRMALKPATKKWSNYICGACYKFEYIDNKYNVDKEKYEEHINLLKKCFCEICKKVVSELLSEIISCER